MGEPRAGSRFVRPVGERLALLAMAGLLALAPGKADGQGTWTPTSNDGAPTARATHTAVWTGSRMIVWGGWDPALILSLGSGGTYEPGSGAWTPTRMSGAPGPRQSHTAVWTGARMIVWGGLDQATGIVFSDGAAYDPATDAWSPTSTTGASSPRAGHTAVWTGSRMIVWGGFGSPTQPRLDDGGVYDPATDTWAALSRAGAPSPRDWHTAVWTGSKMIVWGGFGETDTVGTGGAYDPVTDTWGPVSLSGAPSPRAGHTALWTGSRMIVWGGDGSPGGAPGTGAIYDPATDSWVPTSTAGAPVSRVGHTAIWTGSRMIVWGGSEPGKPFSYSTGGAFDPAAQAWTATPTLDAPGQRTGHTAAWTGWQMLVWGGLKTETTHFYSNGGAYAPDLPGEPTEFYTVTACRVVDTRNPAGPRGGPSLAAGETRSFPVTGNSCGIPSAAVAVSVNVAAVDATAGGYLTLFPGDGAGPPLASAVSFSAGQTRGSNAIVRLATDGTGAVKVKNGSPGAVHLVVDVNGYFR